MHGYRIFKKRRLTRAYANAQPRLSFHICQCTASPELSYMPMHSLAWAFIYANAQPRLSFHICQCTASPELSYMQMHSLAWAFIYANAQPRLSFHICQCTASPDLSLLALNEKKIGKFDICRVLKQRRLSQNFAKARTHLSVRCSHLWEKKSGKSVFTVKRRKYRDLENRLKALKLRLQAWEITYGSTVRWCCILSSAYLNDYELKNLYRIIEQWSLRQACTHAQTRQSSLCSHIPEGLDGGSGIHYSLKI